MTLSEVSPNRILASLPKTEHELIEPFLEPEHLNLGENLDTVNEPIQFLHFPLEAAISVVNMQDAQHMVDITVIGKEGCSGSSLASMVSWRQVHWLD